MAKRGGQVRGGQLRSVLSALSTDKIAIPGYDAVAADLEPDEWVAWSLYVQTTHEFAAHMPSYALVDVGRSVINKAKPVIESLGHTSAGSILKNAAQFCQQVVRDAPKADLVQTVRYMPGHVLVSAGQAHVPELIEGYMRGLVEVFGGTVNYFSGGPLSPTSKRFRYEMRWRDSNDALN